MGQMDRDRREQAWKVMDKLKATLGRDNVRILAARPEDVAWKLRAEHRSPRWTTPWDELSRAVAGGNFRIVLTLRRSALGSPGLVAT